MDPIATARETQETTDEQEITVPPIFGLRYLEEEAAEIHDVVGCLGTTWGGCDDGDIP